LRSDCLQSDVGRRVQAAVAVFLSPKVRDWVVEHIVSGNVERLDIATNATLRADAARRPADARGGLVGRDRRQRRDASPGGGLPRSAMPT
jgi:hypothetical protein